MDVILSIIKEIPQILLTDIMDFFISQWEDPAMQTLMQVSVLLFLWKLFGSIFMLVLCIVASNSFLPGHGTWSRSEGHKNPAGES